RATPAPSLLRTAMRAGDAGDAADAGRDLRTPGKAERRSHEPSRPPALPDPVHRKTARPHSVRVWSAGLQSPRSVGNRAIFPQRLDGLDRPWFHTQTEVAARNRRKPLSVCEHVG